MILPIVIWPNPILKLVAQPVESFDPGLEALLGNMTETMRHARGLGLAAPQVGVSSRVIVLVTGDSVLEAVNPSIQAPSGISTKKEGCLSFPDVFIESSRFDSVQLLFQDRFGQPHSVTLLGMAALAAQHEVDHLDGKVIADRVSASKRQAIRSTLSRTSKFRR